MRGSAKKEHPLSRWWASLSEAEREEVKAKRQATRVRNEVEARQRNDGLTIGDVRKLARHQQKIDSIRASLAPTPPPAPEAPAERNMLSNAQVIQAAAWIERRRSWLESAMPSLEAVTQLAARELPFSITEANVRHCAESLNVNWPRKRRIVSEQMLILRELALAVAELYSDLGTRPNARLLAVLERVENDIAGCHQGNAGSILAPIFLDVPAPVNGAKNSNGHH